MEAFPTKVWLSVAVSLYPTDLLDTITNFFLYPPLDLLPHTMAIAMPAMARPVDNYLLERSLTGFPFGL